MLFPELADKVSYLDYLNRVKSDGRLVQNEHLGISDERLGKSDSLAVTLGKVSYKSLINSVNSALYADLVDMVLFFALLALFCLVGKLNAL